MARMTQVEVVDQQGKWHLIDAREAYASKVHIDKRRCPECGGRIALMPDSVNGMKAHGEHCRGQEDITCSLKDKRGKKAK